MRNVTLAIAFAVILLLGMGGAAAADGPGANASCAGIGSSAVAPLGTRDDVAHNTHAYADATGVTPGYLVTTASRVHAGSFAACFGQ